MDEHPTKEQIEEVAQVIYEANPMHDFPNWQDVPDDMKQGWRKPARAVLENYVLERL